MKSIQKITEMKVSPVTFDIKLNTKTFTETPKQQGSPSKSSLKKHPSYSSRKSEKPNINKLGIPPPPSLGQSNSKSENNIHLRTPSVASAIC